MSTISPSFDPALRARQPGVVRGNMLAAIIDAFERANLKYAILHGYEHYPDIVGSDVDCVIDAKAPQLHRLLHEAARNGGARLVQARGLKALLAGSDGSGAPIYLSLDGSRDSELGALTFYSGAEILSTRRRFRGFWVPAPHLAFGGYLARCIARGVLDERRMEALRKLYLEDAAGCQDQLRRFWSSEDQLLLQAALAGSSPRILGAAHERLRAELVRACARRYPVRSFVHPVERLAGKLGRVLRPDGLSVVLLGPDGAGKSSTSDAIGGSALPEPFERSVCWGFVPPLHRLIGRNSGPSSEPHALPPRSPLNSVAKAFYWLSYAMLNELRVRFAKARGTLVLYDRHFIDVLVDPVRYRYSGPRWLAKLIWGLVPKPDVVILLNAPAEIIQARKQEVPLSVTRQQATAYLKLVQGLDYGRVVDAAQPFPRVVHQATDVILEALNARTVSRLRDAR
jgi:hypothetical protein